jgi:hypothetical protein
VQFFVFLELGTVTARKTDPVLLDCFFQALLVKWAVKVTMGIYVAVSQLFLQLLYGHGHELPRLLGPSALRRNFPRAEQTEGCLPLDSWIIVSKIYITCFDDYEKNYLAPRLSLTTRVCPGSWSALVADPSSDETSPPISEARFSPAPFPASLLVKGPALGETPL